MVLGKNGQYTLGGEKKQADDFASKSYPFSESSTPIMDATSSGGAIVSSIGEGIENMVKNREVYLNTEKTVVGNKGIRELSVGRYKAWKTAGKVANGVGIALAINDAVNDFNEGKAYAGTARILVKGGIMAVGTVCAPCALGLSIGEAYFGSTIYDAVQNFGDKHIYETPKYNTRMGEGGIFPG